MVLTLTFTKRKLAAFTILVATFTFSCGGPAGEDFVTAAAEYGPVCRLWARTDHDVLWETCADGSCSSCVQWRYVAITDDHVRAVTESPVRAP